MDWDFVTRVFLAAFFSFVAALYIHRLTIGDDTQSIKKIFPGQKYSKTWWNHMAFRWFRAAIWAICVTRVFFPQADSVLVLFPSFLIAPVLLSGMILLCVGFAIALISHKQLGDLWRSGIDPKGPNKLQQEGLYKYSRNPMYLGVMTAQLGFFMALPSLFTLVCLIVGISAILRQVYAEESHLKRALPKAYVQYSSAVPRWLFG